MPDSDTVLIPASGSLGGEIRCGDIRRVDGTTVDRIRRFWLDRKVVVMRGQTLTDAELVAFGARFGEFQYSIPLSSPLVAAGKVARQGTGPAGHPEITVVSNVVEGDTALGGLGDGEVIWHSDMSSFDAPPNQTILYALEVPPEGGATSFCDMEEALATLPDALRREIDGLDLKHNIMIDAAGFVRPEYAHLVDAPLEDQPGAIHPLIRTHPETGRDGLFLGRRSNAQLVGMSKARSDELLQRLWQHTTTKAPVWRHEWQAGDLVMWDNRCVMHRREPFDPAARRIMHRIVIKGSPAFRARGGNTANDARAAVP